MSLEIPSRNTQRPGVNMQTLHRKAPSIFEQKLDHQIIRKATPNESNLACCLLDMKIQIVLQR